MRKIDIKYSGKKQGVYVRINYTPEWLIKKANDNHNRCVDNNKQLIEHKKHMIKILKNDIKILKKQNKLMRLYTDNKIAKILFENKL